MKRELHFLRRGDILDRKRMAQDGKKRVLVFIVGYNAEKTIAQVVRRIPVGLLDHYEVDILIIDDSSRDETLVKSHSVSREDSLPFRITTLVNPVNQGYGGNQKLGHRYAIEHGYDFVALIHGDGQYAPECLPDLLEPLRRGESSAVFGSRMLTPYGALRGGMPLYKFAGNKILTWIENKLLHSNLSEFHSGYRLYSTRALTAVPFERNSNCIHFDTEIIIQLLVAELPITELPIPTYYGNEIRFVNGLRYAWDIVVSVVKAHMQGLGLFYDPKFDCSPRGISRYRSKLEFMSPHTLAFDRVPEGSRVLDIGCAGGDLGTELVQRKRCIVDGIDSGVAAAEPELHEFHLHDLNNGLPRLEFAKYDRVLMLDVIEHLARPEEFLEQLRQAFDANPLIEVLISTANIGFFIPRLMLLIGQFNYGPIGILDRTHTRLFTFASFERAIRQSGFDILERVGVPGPFPFALGNNWFSRLLLGINRALIPVSRGLFSYQIFLRIKPRPTVDFLLRTARVHSKKRLDALESA